MSFRSTVRARRLRFAEEPRTEVRFPGTGARESTSHSDRTRLPGKVVPGRDYEDVTVVYHLDTRLTGEGADECGAGPRPRSPR
ncbi:hypothetical protein AB0L74_26140 [Streptomyces sp. NPDC052020]|uniref:hypothetical protein n=1 Tax=Streptomyces sp. NPDC052020 TaxID=3155677 RepID=UPI00341C63CE